MTSPFLTVDELATRWRIKPRAVREEIKRKRLAATKIGGQWLIHPEDVEAVERTRRNIEALPKRTRAPKRRSA